MRGVLGVVCFAVVASACLSSASLSGTPPETCDADLQTDSANCGACGKVCVGRANAYGVCNAGVCTVACNTGFADCNGDPSNGCEVDLENNADNCGKCGRSCGGGRCRDSSCQPVTIAALPGHVRSIAVDDTALYFGVEPTQGTGNRAIVRVPKDGGPPQDLVATLAEAPNELALDATHVYFTQPNTATMAPFNGSVRRVSKGGGSSEQVIGGQLFLCEADGAAGGCVLGGTQGRGGSSGIAVDSGFVYWLHAIGIGDTDGRLSRCTTTGCTEAPVATGLRSPIGILVDGPTVFLSTAGTPQASTYIGRGLFQCAASGCGTNAVKVPSVPETTTVDRMAQNARLLALAGTGSIARMQKLGSDYAPIATTRGHVPGLVVTEERVYWIDSVADALLSCPSDGCKAESPTEVPLNAEPLALTTDGAALYVVASSGQVSVVSRVVR
jgi:hypothetical protein